MDEWTRAETGVGAAIAAGNQLLNGIWALLVIAAIIIIVIRVVVFGKAEKNGDKINQCPCDNIQIIAKRIRTSPIRLVKAVIMPAAKDLLFW